MKRAAILTLILGLLTALAAPIGAQSLSEARREREQVLQQKAQAASRLDTLRSTDAQVEAALADLDAHLRTARAQAIAATQAAEVARAELTAAQARLEEARKRIATLHKQVVDRAVEAYISPRSDAWGEVLSARDLGDLAQRQALLDSVAAHDMDVLDELDAAEEDLAEQEAQLKVLDEKACEREAAAEAALASVAAARAEKARLAAASDQRIAGQIAEIEALGAASGRLEAVIREAEAAASSGTPGAASAAGLIWPVRGQVTSGYGMRWGRMHEGIDVGASTGTPIWAAKAGRVIHSGWMNGYGNVVVIDHGEGFTTVYAHQSRLGTSNGASVDRGQVIGYVGSTGRSTGPHLHFETRFSGSPRNPMNYLP